jgi:heme-degrading monooxygenase HmoA
VPAYHLAQVNIGRFIKQPVDPANADFMEALDHVNALAEASPGFIWRLKGEGNNATDIRPSDADPRLAINMSVWESPEALAAFVYRNMDHRGVMRRRREWFEEMKVYMALWWIPAGHTPTVAEAMEKLAVLERLGPTQHAFTFKQPFPPPSGAGVAPILDECA